MRVISRIVLAGVIFFGIALHAFAYPVSEGYVTDAAGLLSAEGKETLIRELTQFEASTTAEIAVVTVPSLGGDYVEHYAVGLFEAWGIGKKGIDNGLLVLIARDDRVMRIEVGYGLEGTVTDSDAQQVINAIMTPRFREGNYEQGIMEGVHALMAKINGDPSAIPSAPTQANTKIDLASYAPFFMYLVMMMLSVMGRTSSWWLGGIFGGVAALVIYIVTRSVTLGVNAFLFLVPAGLFFDYLISKKYKESISSGQTPPWWTGGSRGIGGGTSGGRSFGGFGGGRSGGGGGSGRW